MLRADLAHFALALDDRGGHQRLDAELAQRRRNFFHFGGAAFAVARHAFKIVGNDLRPIEAGIVILQGSRDFVDHAGARGGEKAFERQRLHAFHDHAAYHFDRRGGADVRPGDAGAHGERGEEGRDRLGVRAGKQERRLMPRRIDRRDDGDIDIARAVGEKLLGLLLAGRRDGIDVEKIRLAGQMRPDRKRCINARRRGHRRNDHVGVAQRVGGGGGAAHADRVGRALELFALGFRKQDVPGGDAHDAFMRRPAAIAWPASPKPMKHRAGLLSGIVGPHVIPGPSVARNPVSIATGETVLAAK